MTAIFRRLAWETDMEKYAYILDMMTTKDVVLAFLYLFTVLVLLVLILHGD